MIVLAQILSPQFPLPHALWVLIAGFNMLCQLLDGTVNELFTVEALEVQLDGGYRGDSPLGVGAPEGAFVLGVLP